MVVRAVVGVAMSMSGVVVFAVLVFGCTADKGYSKLNSNFATFENELAAGVVADEIEASEAVLRRERGRLIWGDGYC